MKPADIFDTLSRAEFALAEEIDSLHHNPKALEEELLAAETALGAMTELRRRIEHTFDEVVAGVLDRISAEGSVKGFSRREQERARQAAIDQLGTIHRH